MHRAASVVRGVRVAGRRMVGPLCECDVVDGGSGGPVLLRGMCPGDVGVASAASAEELRRVSQTRSTQHLHPAALVNAGPLRAEEDEKCVHHRTCDRCPWQHVSESAIGDLKRAALREWLTSDLAVGAAPVELLPPLSVASGGMMTAMALRATARELTFDFGVTVGDRRALGVRWGRGKSSQARGDHRGAGAVVVAPVSSCMIASPAVKRIVAAVGAWCETLAQFSQLKRLTVVIGDGDDGASSGSADPRLKVIVECEASDEIGAWEASFVRAVQQSGGVGLAPSNISVERRAFAPGRTTDPTITTLHGPPHLLERVAVVAPSPNGSTDRASVLVPLTKCERGTMGRFRGGVGTVASGIIGLLQPDRRTDWLVHFRGHDGALGLCLAPFVAGTQVCEFDAHHCAAVTHAAEATARGALGSDVCVAAGWSERVQGRRATCAVVQLHAGLLTWKRHRDKFEQIFGGGIAARGPARVVVAAEDLRVGASSGDLSSSSSLSAFVERGYTPTHATFVDTDPLSHRFVALVLLQK